MNVVCVFFFFFQAEDGIRDLTVTGVQTCALPISHRRAAGARGRGTAQPSGARRAAARRLPHRPPGASQAALEPEGSRARRPHVQEQLDRKSTRLNSSHSQISYAVFCLKTKNKLHARQT